MFTTQKKHNTATFLENDEDIKRRAELIAHLQAEDDLLEQRFLLILCFILISVLWIAIML